jgi:hypothetical protein
VNEGRIHEVLRVPGEARREALGFALPDRLRGELRAITPASFAATRAQYVTLIGGGDASFAPLLGSIRPAAGAPRTREVESGVQWASDAALNTALVPIDAMAVIVSSLLEPA